MAWSLLEMLNEVKRRIRENQDNPNYTYGDAEIGSGINNLTRREDEITDDQTQDDGGTQYTPSTTGDTNLDFANASLQERAEKNAEDAARVENPMAATAGITPGFGDSYDEEALRAAGREIHNTVQGWKDQILRDPTASVIAEGYAKFIRDPGNFLGYPPNNQTWAGEMPDDAYRLKWQMKETPVNPQLQKIAEEYRGENVPSQEDWAAYRKVLEDAKQPVNPEMADYIK